MSMKACTHDGRPLRFFTIMDEHTRECLAIDVERKMNHQHVLARLADLFIMHEVPGYIRSNKGNEFTAKVETLCVIPLRSGNLERLSFCGCGNTAMILIWIPDQVGNDSIIANRVGNERSRLNLLFQQLVLWGRDRSDQRSRPGCSPSRRPDCLRNTGRLCPSRYPPLF